MRSLTIPCATALLLASCGGGGGGGGGSTLTSVSGTAAVGAPLANAAIDAKCRAGSGSTTSDAAGRFTINLSGAQAPCLLKASGQGVELFSVLPANSGTANLTSLTHLLSARLLKAAPGSAYAGAGESSYVLVTDQGVSAAQGEVAAEILRMGAAMPTVNWVTQPFTAAAGDAMDGALELLKRRLEEQGKTLDVAAGEIATGDLLNLKPPSGQSPTCIPGLIAGFGGPMQDTLSRVVGQDNSGGGDAPGGIGGGDGVGDGAAGGVGVGGSLGQFVNVDVSVQFASGTSFGPVRVNSATTNGMVTLVPCDLAPPALVTVTGVAGAQYFDEQLAAPASFVGQTLRTILTRFDRNGGVTPFTEAMVRRTLQLGGEVATDGGHRLKALEKAVDSWKDAARVQIAHDEVLRSVNDLLPGIYRLEDLRRLPVIVNQTNSAQNSAVLTDNQNGVYGAVLAGLAKAAGTIQPGAETPALTTTSHFVADLADGVRDLRSSGTPVVGVGGATYNYDTFAARLTTETGATAKALGAGALKTKTVPVQRLKGKAGTNFAAPANWVFTLASDGTLQIQGPSGQSGPALPAGTRFSRIDVFDRSTRTPAQYSNDPWQNCLVATASDGRRLLTWQVGVAASGFTDMANVDFDDVPATPAKSYAVGSNGDPVVTVAPESLSLPSGSGGDSILFVLRSGTLGAVGGCDVHDQHPGLAGGFGNRYVVQVQQDFGNRYVLYSDGKLEGWGRKQNALGIAERAEGVLDGSDRRAVVAETGSSPLEGVAMLTRGERIHETRALIRSADPAKDGKVMVWGDGLPVPRPMGGLEKICWIAGPYAVGCNGALFYATVTAVTNEIPAVTVAQVSGVPPIWRVSADYPVRRVPDVDPQNQEVDLTDLEFSYSAIAQDGSVYRIADGVATLE
jgi:hypothetical protein